MSCLQRKLLIQKEKWQLKKAMYGLKQSSRSWNQKLDKTLAKIGLTKCKADQCIHYIKTKEGMVIVEVYVDNLIFSNNEKLKNAVKSQLTENFEMKDLGTVKRLGMNITRNRDNRTLWFDQEDYIQKILKKFKMQNSKSVTTPLDPNTKLDQLPLPQSTEELKEMSDIRSRSCWQFNIFVSDIKT